MKTIIQTKLHDSENGVIGNCFATIVACFLELPIEEIPAFEEKMYLNDEWVDDVQAFLNEKGWEWGALNGHLNTGEFYIVVGKSPRNPSVNHACIYQNGKIFHDPHPDKTGILTEDVFEYLNKI